MDSQLTDRLGRLEARHRTLVRAYVASLLVACLGMLLVFRQQEKAPESITANSFRVVDKDGKLRGTFGMTEKGIGLKLSDIEGNERAGLTISRDGSPTLRLFGKDRRNMAVVNVGEDGMPTVSLFSKDKECFSSLFASSDGQSTLVMRSQAGSVNLGIKDDGSPALALTSKDEKSVAALWVTKEGSPTLFLRIKGGKPAVSFKIDPNGSSGVGLSDSQGVLRAALGLDEDGTPHFGLLNKDGK